MQISIPFFMSDLRQQAWLLLACMQVQQFQNAADAVHIILWRSPFFFLLAWFQLGEQTYNWRGLVLLCKRTPYTPSAQCERRESAVKALWAPWKHRESAEHLQQELRRIAVERPASSVATPWSLLGRRDRPFFTKNIRFFFRSHGAPENSTIPCQHSGNAAWCDRGFS